MHEVETSDFIERQGPAFLAHLMRRLSDALVDGCAQWHETVGIPTSPRTSSTLLALDEHGSLAVTELSALLHQSHPMVIKTIALLRQQGLAKVSRDANDARRSLLSLTPKGRAVVKRLRAVLATVERAMTALADEAMPGLVQGLWAMERQVRATPFIERLRTQERLDQGRSP